MINVNDLIAIADNNKHHEFEVNRRNAIHCGYYAAFHTAKNTALFLNIDLKQIPTDSNGKKIYSTHKKLGYLLSEYGKNNRNARIKRIGDALFRLHDKRCKADYDLDLAYGFSNQDVGQHVLECMQFITLNEDVLNPVKSS